MENASRRSPQEKASTSSDHDVSKSEKNDTADASEEEEECADDQQTGAMSGNLLARFNMERDEPQTAGAKSSEDLQPAGLDPGKERDREELGLSSSIPLPGGQNAVDENTKWMQRATWKSLMGADGRATFSLKQLTGESGTTDVKPSVNEAVPEQSFNTFSFNFARNPPEAPESKPKPVNPERAEKKPKSGPAVNVKPAKVSDDEAGCSFMKSADAEKEWRASKSELRIDSKAKHKAAVRKMKKMKGSVGAR